MAIRKALGFTLIEVLVVVVIISVLAAIAIPAFNDQIRKSRRADVQGKMEDIRLRLERFRVDNPTYAMPFTSATWSETRTSGSSRSASRTASIRASRS